MGHASLEDIRDAAIAEQARIHAAAITTNIRSGHEQTLTSMAESFAFRVSQSGVTEMLIRTAMNCGPLTSGQLLIDLIQKCIDADAENDALKEVERMEVAGKADPARCMPKTRAIAAFAEHAI